MNKYKGLQVHATSLPEAHTGGLVVFVFNPTTRN
jgi:hypothetical protein